MKSEPSTFSIDDLKQKKRSIWDGVRNYQARNYMRDEMKKNDIILFYHSSCEVPGVVGIAKVIKESHPDPTQFDKKSKYYDPKATPENPRWFLVEIEFVEKLNKAITLQELKGCKGLENLPVVKKGNRLSINPITDSEFLIIKSLF